MDKQLRFRIAVTFIVTFIIAFFIVGYVRNTMFVQIEWLQSATVLDRFREYYIRTFSLNVIPTLIIAIITTLFVGFINKVRS